MVTGLLFGILNLSHWDLPFDRAQGGELVEPFEIWVLMLGISMIIIKQQIYVYSVSKLFKNSGVLCC
jgi:hypothetical protein